MNKIIRWRQRFSNFEKSFTQLKTALAIPQPNDTECAGIIQFFELSFELSWKTLEDFLEAEGFQTTSPRDTLKQAFQSGYIRDGNLWMEVLDDRNLTVHTYDEATAKKVEKLIREKYFPLLEKFHADFMVKK